MFYPTAERDLLKLSPSLKGDRRALSNRMDLDAALDGRIDLAS